MSHFWSAFIFTIFLSIQSIITAQVVLDQTESLEWQENQTFSGPLLIKDIIAPSFRGGEYGSQLPYLPYFTRKIALQAKGHLKASLSNLVLEDIEGLNENFKSLPAEAKVDVEVRQSRKSYKGFIHFVPILQTSPGVYKKIVAFDLKVEIETRPQNIKSRGGPFTTTSLLSSGTWYKIATPDQDVYKLSLDFFTSELGISANSLDPNLIKVYGNGGGVVPQANDADRIDDLEEVAIHFVGDPDNQFESDEYFLFFAESADNEVFDTANNRLKVSKNPYSFDNHYFIKIDGNPGLRVQSSQVSTTPTATTDQYLDIQHYENELFNVLDYRPSSHGSGKRWFGELFTGNQTRALLQEFNVSDYIPNQSISWHAECGVVSFTSNSQFTITVGDDTDNKSFSRVETGTGNTVKAVDVKTLSGATTGAFGAIDVEFSPTSSESAGWLDYLQLVGEKDLSFKNNDITHFYRDKLSLEHAAVEYELESAVPDILIWDLSNQNRPANIQLNDQGGVKKFVMEGNSLNEFIAINPNTVVKSPIPLGAVPNQNLHSLNRADMIVVYHADFKSVADRIMAHRQERDGLICQSANIAEIYNEFSSGSVDATALRDFCRMIYERDPDFKYLLLVGDGTFDMRHIRSDVADQNFICTYQTTESERPIVAYPSDDYFALLDDDEGDNLRGGMDIAVGRLPIQSVNQGNHIVDKIIQYETDADFRGDWKLFMTLVADDQDNNLHFNDSRDLSRDIDTGHPEYEISKINLDAFEQEANSAGDRYPEVNEKINSNYAKGQFLVNYYGHGGNRGLGQERILTIPDILSWDQREGYPMVITATCSFASFDDPDFESAGEIAINQAGGGAVALLSTTRIVFAQKNDELVKELFDRFLEKKPDGSLQSLGDVLIAAKNDLSFGGEENSRKFSLFGDPSMQIPLPFFDVVVTSINDKDVTNGQSDTLGALQRVTLSGHIAQNGVKQSDFNGEVSSKVFDKPITLKTLGQDSDSNKSEFTVQNNVLFQGRSSVVNGEFTYSFIVPQDINYAIGEGKIVHYAKNDSRFDAGGVQENVIIGGTSANGITDDEPPSIELFLNSESFESGNTVSNRPVLLANLSDDFGINIAGTSVGHDLVAIIDGDVKNTIILNEFYKAKLDEANKGSLEYPLSTLEVGLHQLTLRAWDIANNKAESSIEFLVMDQENFSLDRVFNYPNPFTTSTSFQFEHDLPSSSLDVQVDIYTISGHRVKSIQETLQSSGGRVSNIAWNGQDDYGDQLARGVYLYKIQALSNTITDDALSAESEFERLVILK